jgi:hypothetical protein
MEGWGSVFVRKDGEVYVYVYDVEWSGDAMAFHDGVWIFRGIVRVYNSGRCCILGRWCIVHL